MRWPFGPPHLTLKTLQKNKTRKKQKHNKKTPKKTEQQHPTTRPRTKQTKQKQKQDKKEKQTQETQKHLNLPNPDEQQWATPEKPQKFGKTSIFNTFETIPDTPKPNLLILKPQKNKPKKHHFAMFKNNPLFFINVLFFSTYSFCFWKAVFCWKHYKNSVFRKTQLFKNTVSKTHFFNHVKKHLFQRKGVIFDFGQFPLKPQFSSFCWFTLFWSKKILANTDSCNENARFFSLPDTNSVRQFLLKIHFFWFFTFLDDHLKNSIFIGFFAIFLFCFFFFLFLFLQHKKKEKN